MPEHCEHIRGTRQMPYGTANRCGLLEEAAGWQGIYVPLSRCAKCSGADDDGHVGKCIKRCLWHRVAREHSRENVCETCGGPTISVDEAVKRLKERDPEKAADALVVAVQNGMKEADALTLADKYFPAEVSIELPIEKEAR